MTNSAQFDPNALAAVKPGLDATLAEISVQLEHYLGAPAANAAALEKTRAELHRMLGVLKMVGLDGASVFCAEMELALSELAASPQQISTLHRDGLRHALFAITHFLDSLANGADNAALRLFPQYQELQNLRGMEMSFEQDLFYPNLAVRLPPQVLSGQPQGGAQNLKVLRGQYQQGLMKWLRQDDTEASVQSMQQALGHVLSTVPKDSDSRAFWWVSIGFLGCLKAGVLPTEFNARKMLGNIDQQLRTIAEGKTADVSAFMYEMLFQIGHSRDMGEAVEEIRQVYALDNYLLELSVLPPSEVAQLLGVLREQLRVAEETWEQCIQGNEAACKNFIEQAEQLALQSDKLDRNTLQYLAKQIQALAQYATVPEHARPIGMDMAMALLLLGSGIDNYSHLGSGFQEQARILSERMQAAVKQQPEDPQRLLELVDLHGQMERGNATIPLANEMLANLQRVEQGLSAFFSDETQRDGINELLRLLTQIQGGLHMLSLQHAEKLLAAIQENVRRFAQGEHTKPIENHALADAMSALENYLQHLTHRQAGEVTLLQKSLAEMAQASQAVTKMEAEAAQQLQAAALMPAIDPEQTTTRQTTTPQTPVPQAHTQQPVPQPQRGPAPTPSQLDEDQELLDIFLEEAQEVLAAIRENLETSLLQPGGREPLVSIRRGFHTLKGSGRMVGLNDFGEVAWCVERALNKWLEDNHQSATPGLLHFISQAVISFGGWVDELNQRGQKILAGHSGEVNIDAEHLVMLALKVENSLDAEILPASLSAPADAGSAPPGPGEPDSLSLEYVPSENFPTSDIEFAGLESSSPESSSPESSSPESSSLESSSLESPSLDSTSLESLNLEILGDPSWGGQSEQPAANTADNVPALDFEFEPGLLFAPGQFAPGLELESTDEGVVGAGGNESKGSESGGAHSATGGIALSPALFKIAAAEAVQNVAVLHKQFSELCAAEPPVVKYDFMRAAHTLAGVNRTMGYAAVVELSFALEGWLQARVDKPFMLGDEQLQLLLETITALDEMVQLVCLQQVPDSRSDLAHQLHEDKVRLGEPSLELVEPLPASARAPVPAAAPAPTPASAPVAAPPAAAGLSDKPQVRDDVDEQLLPVFIEEADELCPLIGSELRAWREHPHNEPHVQTLGRLLHTLKGSSRMVGAMRIGEIAHEMEDRVMVSPKLRDVAGYWDVLESDFDRITVLLEALRSGKAAPETAEHETQRANIDRRGGGREGDGGGERALPGNMLRVRSDAVDRMVNEASEISVARLHMETELRTVKEGLQDLSTSVTRLRQQLREVEIQAESQIQAQVSLSKDSGESFDPLEFDRFTRLQELTRFMNESVHDVQTVQQTLLKNLDGVYVALAAQARINRELQQSLMTVRMVPFNSIADRLYRIVRQTGKEINKRANLELLDAEVELDRSVLEKMTAPFEHLLRNAMVHGLESHQLREQAGKNPIGEIRLGLRQESNEVVFDLSDDGAGLNFAALREKAITKGLLAAGEKVSDEQLAQLIFTSGLSTASEVTEIAGRGVGMDVVRSEIAALGGRIDVVSRSKLGTQFIIHLPLTLAVMQALLVRSGDAIYAIPSTLVEQVNQVKSAEMEKLHRVRRVEWQGKIYPLHYMPHLLGDSERVLENLPRNPVLLLRSGEQRIAMHVDELLGKQEVVVKNIGPQLARLSGISGATVMGNGKVVLILNPTQLAQRISPTIKTETKAGTQVENGMDAKAMSKAVKVGELKPLHSQPLVMVVDDSFTVRKVTTRMLTRAGYQVVTAKDGIDALEQLEQFTPQVMLLDIEMPRMDGFALARQLRRDPKTQNLPIIMITSRTADKHRDYAKQLGINTYLGKPYQEDTLLQNIADYVAVHKLDA